MDEHQMKDEALRLALEALEYIRNCETDVSSQTKYGQAEEVIKQALEQPEPEPVAWMWKDGTITADSDRADGTWTPLYTSPPKREWQGLTDEERSYYLQTASNIGWWKASEIIEAKLKAKNGFPQTEKNT